MRLRNYLWLSLALALLPLPAPAGTTGGITGRVFDAQTHQPIAGVLVTATSPSQSARSTSDATGTFRFLSLAPDTYALSFTRTGYDPVAQAGITGAPTFSRQTSLARLTSR